MPTGNASGSQEPVGGLVEDLSGRKLVHQKTTAAKEALILLQHIYPKDASLETLSSWMDRRKPDTVRRALNDLWTAKLVDGTSKSYSLTKAGYTAAVLAIRDVVEE